MCSRFPWSLTMTSLQTERTTFTGKPPGAAQMHPDVPFLGLMWPSSSPELVVVGVLAEKALLSTLSPRRTRGFFVTLRRFTIQPWRRCQWMWLTWFEPWDFKKKNTHSDSDRPLALCLYYSRGGKNFSMLNLGSEFWYVLKWGDSMLVPLGLS